MTDNGPCYKPSLSRSLPEPRHQTHPHQTLHPKTNGKAERFIQTALREWAYAVPTTPPSVAPRTPHGCTATIGIGLMGHKIQTPISRLGLTENNLLRLHI